ncbi:MAG: putative toxin-antitoxin system toxin component, PIN family [Gallionella sp.]|nr:putative toxin-antitoxin system toxin component, PIN family [Gallionella sp.]
MINETSAVSFRMLAWRHGSVDIFLSVYILDELRRVLPRLTNRHGLTLAEIEDLVDALSLQTEIIEPLPSVEPDFRDMNDLPVLGTLLAALKTSDIDYLITGDKNLLVMSERYPIVPPANFWSMHAGL